MQDTRRWPARGRRVPVQLWLVILPLATGLGLVGYVVAGISLRLGIALGAAVGLGAAMLVVGRTPADQRARLRRRALAGAAGGVTLPAAAVGALLAMGDRGIAVLMEGLGHTDAVVRGASEDAVRGRIFSLLYMVINGVTAVPVLIAAALSDTLGINHVIGALGALLALTGVAVAGLAQRVFAEEKA